MNDLALHARARESGLEALGELGLADAREAGHVHRDARLQANGNQLNEVRELHVVAVNKGGAVARVVG